MSQEARRQSLELLIEAFNRGELALLDKCLTEDATYTFYGTTKFAGVNNARENIRNLAREAFPEGIKFWIRHIVVDGDYGAIHWEDYATRSGLKYHNYGVFFVQFEGEKVKHIWEYIDYERFKVFLEYSNYQRNLGESRF
ncbi:MAG: nuclear transport factor 2 family protein [Nitrososphaerota archaeon]